MIKKIRKKITHCLQAAARRIDIPIPTSSPSGHARTEPFFDCLTKLGFRPRHIVDIGANRGNWTRTAIRYFPEARFTLFEPQGGLLAGSDLDGNKQVQIFAMGVGPATATMLLSKHARDDSFSFALSKAEAAALGREQVEAPVVALDEFLPQQGIPFPDMLKIDAEGWDLEVLKGAEAAVSKAEVVLLEAAVMNKRFPNKIASVISEMENRGLVLFDITDINRTQKHNALWLVEIAFVKTGGKLDSGVDAYL